MAVGMIDGEAEPVRFAGITITRPWCDCRHQGRGFTLHNGRWVRPCCGRPAKANHDSSQCEQIGAT